MNHVEQGSEPCLAKVQEKQTNVLWQKRSCDYFPCLYKEGGYFLHQLLKDLTRCFPIIELKSGIRNDSRVCHKAHGSSVK